MRDEIDFGIDGLNQFESIGSGGFSSVYSAWDEGFHRRVAVKVLHSLDADGRRRFERERSIMGQLSGHPNVITPFRFGYTANGAPFLVMELVEGGSLEDLAQEGGGTLPWSEVVEHLVPISGALGYAHGHGVLHRDVKPGNILLDGSIPKLTDFGIAAIRESTTSQIAYTLAHCPPETFADGDDRRDERSDLYSMASTLYALIAGRPPFAVEGSDSQQAYMFRILDHEPAELPDEIAPEPLQLFLQSALAKDPEARPQSATEFADQLLAIKGHVSEDSDTVAGPSVVSGPVSEEAEVQTVRANDSPVPAVRRQPIVIALAAAAVAGLVLLAVALVIALRDPSQPVETADPRGSEAAGDPQPQATVPEGLTLSLGTDMLEIVQGDTTQLGVTIQREGGFDGQVGLAIDGIPDGVDVEAPSLPPGIEEVTLTISASSAAPPDTASMTITATNPSIEPIQSTLDLVVSAPPCPSQFAGNGHFYDLVQVHLTWDEARLDAETRLCQSDDSVLRGYLATVTSDEENDFLSAISDQYAWLGGTDQDVEGEWRWATGPETGQLFWLGEGNGSAQNGFYNNWKAGEPNDDQGFTPSHFLLRTGVGDDFGFLEGEWNDASDVPPGEVWRFAYWIEFSPSTEDGE